MDRAICDHVFVWRGEHGGKLCFLRVASTGGTPPETILAGMKDITKPGLTVEVSTEYPSRFSSDSSGGSEP